MRTRGTTRSTRRRLGAGVAATAALTTALGLAVAPTQAQAAGPGWDPKEFGLPYLPTQAVDGEISVTQVGADGKGLMTSFLRDGTSVVLSQQLPGEEHVWSPGGDVISTQRYPNTYLLYGSGDVVTSRFTYGASQWSPFGDSTTESWPISGKRYAATRWAANYYTADVLMPDLGYDPGAAAVTPDGYGVVVSMPSAGTSSGRDLGLAAKSASEVPAFPRLANKKVQTRLGTPSALGYGALDARLPAIAADGTLAFVGNGEKGTALFVDEGAGPVAVATLGADCPGQRPSFAPSARAIAFLVAGFDCSTTTLHVLDRTNGSFEGGTDTVVASSPSGSRFTTASWRPSTPVAESLRLGGKDRIATGIAVSTAGWPNGSFGAVLTSSTSFADAVVGSPLAGQAEVPLLINGASTLDSRVLGELKRLMPSQADRFVYVVGGTGSIGATVEKSLEANGFVVARLAGADRYATSVAVAREMDQAWSGYPEVTRISAFLADGTNFPDALTAGPAASAFYAPVLLTKGPTNPAPVRSYINGRSQITDVYGIGGTAAVASRAYTSKARRTEVYGQDRYSTSLQVARKFFPDAAIAGYASGEAFPDALTGSALQGYIWQPLLLVQQDAVPSATREQAVNYRPSTDTVLVFGGTGAITDKTKSQLVGHAGRQTALWGWTTPLEPNPDMPAALAHGSAAESTRDGLFRSHNAAAASPHDGAATFKTAGRR